MQSCRSNSGCNAWVYCGKVAGCNNGFGQVYQFESCTLKYQAGVAAGGLPQLYGTYGGSDFTASGTLLGKLQDKWHAWVTLAPP